MKNRICIASALAIAGSAALPFLSPARGDTFIDSHWLGGNTSWQTNAQWDNGTFPNNAGTTHYNAIVNSGTASLPFGGSAIRVDSLTIGAGGTVNDSGSLTTDAATVDGRLTFNNGGLQIGASGVLGGTGTVTMLGGVLRGTSALTIGDSLHVNVNFGQIGTSTTALINRGIITGGDINQPPLLTGSSIENLGTIRASGGELIFGGSFTLADLGNLEWAGGGFQIGGTLQNAGQTFHVESGKPWFVSGTISGGTVNIDAGASLSIPYFGGATFNNVVINGTVYHGGGMPLNTTELSGNAVFKLENAFLEGPSRIKSASTLTVASTVLVHGAGGFLPGSFTIGVGSGFEAQTLVNHGTIRSDSEYGVGPTVDGELSIIAPSTLNDGTLASLSNSFIYSPGSVTFNSGGVLDVQMSPTANGLGLLRLAGKLDLTTAGDSLQLSLGSGCVPGTYYQIVKAGSYVGQFDSVTSGFNVQYRSGHAIWAALVPEPTALSLLSIATALLVCRRRRI